MLSFTLQKASVVKDNFGEVHDKQRLSHRWAHAIAALCVGGMVVARALVDRALADELRDARMAMALKLDGWANAADFQKARTASGKSKTRFRTARANVVFR